MVNPITDHYSKKQHCLPDPSRRKPVQILHLSTNVSTAQHNVSHEKVKYVVIHFFTSVLKKLTLTDPLASIPLSPERMLK